MNNNSFLSNEVFKSIWDNIIYPKIKYFMKLYQLQLICNIEEAYTKLLLEVRAKKSFTHHFMRKESNFLDRHKIAAIMTHAILEVQPIQQYNKKNLLKKIEQDYCNEILAFHCAEIIIISFIYTRTLAHSDDIVVDRKKFEIYL